MASRGDTQNLRLIKFADSPGASPGNNILYSNGSVLLFNGTQLASSGNLFPVLSTDTVTPLTQPGVTFTSNLILRQSVTSVAGVAGQGFQYLADGRLFFNEAEVAGRSNLINILTSNIITSQASNLQIRSNLNVLDTLFVNDSNVVITSNNIVFSNANPTLLYNAASLNILSTNYGGVLKLLGNATQSNVWLVSGDPNNTIGTDVSNFSFVSKGDATSNTNFHSIAKLTVTQSDTLDGSGGGGLLSLRTRDPSKAASSDQGDSDVQITMLSCNTSTTANTVVFGPGGDTDNVYVGIGRVNPTRKFEVYQGGKTVFAVDGVSSKAIIGSGVSIDFVDQISITGALSNRLQIGTSSAGVNSTSLGISAGGAGSQSVALGYQAGAGAQGPQSVSIGYQAGQAGQGCNSISVGYQAGQTSQSTNAIAIGHWSGLTSQGISSVAIGELAGFLSQGCSSVALGEASAFAGQGPQSVSIGRASGENYQGSQALAIGFQAGQYNQGRQTVSMGVEAGRSAQGSQSISVGYQAGQSTQGIQSLAIGYQSGQTSQGSFAVAIGANAGKSTQLIEAVAIGTNAGTSSQGIRAIAIGTGAGQITQAGNAIAIGYQAGQSNQGKSAIAIGAQAAYLGFVGSSNTVAIGQFAGRTNQGKSAVSIGTEAGFDTQSANSIAIGIQAGYTLQSNSAVSIGSFAGQTQQGSQSVSIGEFAGQTSQFDGCIAIGSEAGQTTQSLGAVAIGFQAGQSIQGTGAVAIGYRAGLNNQGSYSVGIGYLANPNLTSTIILNASGGLLTPQSGQSFYVRPIRDSGTTEFAKVLSYNDGTSEVYKHTTIYTSPTTVGIGNATPSNLLCVGVNTYFRNDDGTGSNVIITTGNVLANTYFGSGLYLSNIAGASSNGIQGSGSRVPVITVDLQGRITSISNTAITQFGTLQQVTATGNTSSETLQLTNAGVGLVATGNVGVGNTIASNLLCIGSNAYFTRTGSNALVITSGNVTASHFHGNAAFMRSTVSIADGIYGSSAFVPSFTITNGRITNVTEQGVTGSQTLAVTLNLGNNGSKVINISNSLSLTTTGSVGIANVDPLSNLLCIGANTWVSPTDIYTFGNVAANNFIATSNIIQLGLQAGLVSQGANTIAIGSYSGKNGQNTFAISIGDLAGQSGQYQGSVAIGQLAGQLNQRSNAITIGAFSGQTGQNTYAIALGDLAGQSGQYPSAIAVGQRAGQLNQKANAITIGSFAGQSGQNTYAVSIGDLAGQNGQYQAAVAIGQGAGQSVQGSSAVAIGYLAGQTNQGNNSIAIGNQAGSSTAGSIMLNASGTAKNTAVAGLHAFPVRTATTNGYVLEYNTSTGEIYYNNTTLNSNYFYVGANAAGAAPTAGSISTGTKLLLWNDGSGYAIGVEGNYMWFNVIPAAGYKWYVNATAKMLLDTNGNLQVFGAFCGFKFESRQGGGGFQWYSDSGNAILYSHVAGFGAVTVSNGGNLTTAGNISNGTLFMVGRHIGLSTNTAEYKFYADSGSTLLNAQPGSYVGLRNNNSDRFFVNSTESYAYGQMRSPVFYADNYFTAGNGFRMYSNQLQRGTGSYDDFGNVALYWGDSNLNLYARANATIFLRVNNAERFWVNNAECYAYGQIRSAYVRSDGGIYGAGTIETWGGSAGYLVGSRNNYYSFMIYSQWGQLFIFSYETNTESHRFLHWGGAARRDSYIYWDAWSDRNMKTDIVDANLDTCYENIKNMNLKRFCYKDEIESIDKHDKYRLGFIAQDLQEIFPKSVRENRINEGKFLSLNLDQLNYTLYGAVQKIMEKVEIQKTEFNLIQNQIPEIKTQLSTIQNQFSNVNTQISQTSTQLSETNQELSQTKTQLTETVSQISETRTNLLDTNQELSQTKTQLSETKQDLSQTKIQLSQTTSQLLQTGTILLETKQDLLQTKTQLSETRTQLAETSYQLTETKQELAVLKNSTIRGSVALVNGAATVSIDTSTLGANPQLFLQPRMSFDRVIGEIDGTQINITCEKVQSTATIDWLIVSG